MDLLQLRYFQTVARLEHMTRAARELQIAQPSLSQMIARLEEELGVPLFDRQKRQLRLNAFGKAFLVHVDRLLAELDEGRRELSDMAGLERGQIVLGVLHTLSRLLLPNILRDFRAEHPMVNFRLFQSSVWLDGWQRLMKGELDLSIMPVPIDVSSEIAWAPLLTEEIFLAVPAGHRLAGRGSIRLSEVAHETFIGLKPGYNLREITDNYCLKAGFEPDVAFEGDEFAMIRGLVEAGLGVTFIPALSWGDTVDQVVQLRIEEPICQRIVGLFWLKERYLSLAARALREFLIAYFVQVQMETQQQGTSPPTIQREK